MLKKLTLSAALLTLLCPTLRAGALEEAFSTAAAAARQAQNDPCSDNKDLEKMVFRFKLDGVGDSASMDVRFAFVSCDAAEKWHDDTPAGDSRAIRRYKGDNGGYDLVLETAEGSDSSAVVLTQAPHVVNWLGNHSNVALLTKRIDFPWASVLDIVAQETMRGPAFLLSYDPTPTPAPDGTDCR